MADEVTRPMTFGEKAVGLAFNPSGDNMVTEIKSRFAQIIDLCDQERRKAGVQGEVGRMWSIAITQAQDAQMWAVKAATWKD